MSDYVVLLSDLDIAVLNDARVRGQVAEESRTR